MKIAELFAVLGFDIRGGEALPKVDAALAKVDASTTKILFGLGALNAAFYLMMYQADQAALALQNYALSTGLSTGELQQWQYAAGLVGIKGDEIAGVFSRIARAQAEIKLGRGNIAPFQYFGISVDQTPAQIMRQLHAMVMKGDPNIARAMAGQLGISDELFAMIRRPEFNQLLDSFNKNLALTKQQQAALVGLNKAWKDISSTLGMLRNQFLSIFGSSFARILHVFHNLLQITSDWLNKLNGSSETAARVRMALTVVLIGLLAVVAALTALAAAGAILAPILALVATGFMPVLLAAAPFVILLGAVIAAVVFLIFAIQDFITAMNGGKSALNWSPELLKITKEIWDTVNALLIMTRTITHLKGLTAGGIFGTLLSMPFGPIASLLPKMFGGSAVHQNNNVTVHVDGSGQPHETATEVGHTFRSILNNASTQIPIPAW